jgi:hypothetical protein
MVSLFSTFGPIRFRLWRQAFHIALITATAAGCCTCRPNSAAAEESSQPIAARQQTAPPNAKRRSVQIAHWIEELGHDAYPVRQAAAEHLLSAGPSARKPLVAIADNPDPETRAAARRIVALIDRTEFERQLEAFAADLDGKLGLTLPGWDEFRDRVGADADSRELFVDMQRQEGPLLRAVFSTPTQSLQAAWEERVLHLVQWQPTTPERMSPPLGTCASIIFLGSVPEMEVSDRGAMLVENVIQRPPIRENLLQGSHREVIRRLVAGWILHCPNRNEAILYRRLFLASTNLLNEALPLAINIVRGGGDYPQVQPMNKAAAILLIGQLGGQEHIELLEPLLSDATVCQAVAPGQSVQIRDVALVVVLHLSGQQPSDYGYVNARVQPQQMFQLQTLSIGSDQQRNEALARWREWQAGHREEPTRAASSSANE